MTMLSGYSGIGYDHGSTIYGLMTMKTCTKCLQPKPEEEFPKDKRRLDGHHSWCKKCMAYKTRKWIEECPEKRAERRVLDNVAQVEKKRQERNASRAPMRAWLDAHTAEVRELEEWWAAVLAEPHIHMYEYMIQDRSEASAYAEKHGIGRASAAIMVCPDIRAKFLTMKEIRKALRGSTPTSHNQVWSRLPYTPKDLAMHFESLWQEGMAWDNYGTEWCIDHVKPYAAFGVKELGDAAWKQAFALSNLQPLTQKDNCHKSLQTWEIPTPKEHTATWKPETTGIQYSLTEDQVRDIRKSYVPGIYGMTRLARKYGVKEKTIRAIIRRASYRWVKDE